MRINQRAAVLRGLLILASMTVALTITGKAHAGFDSLQQAMYFQSKVHDAENCNLTAANGKLVFPDEITNPAITCPDAFAWKKLLETIQSEFWKNWAYDDYTYPSEPYALCDGNSKNCCDPGSKTNPGYNSSSPAEHCPYFPGDHKSDKFMIQGKRTFKQKTNHFPSVHGVMMNKADPGRVIRQEMAEVVFRNRPFWEYTFTKNLYNQDGLAAVYNNINNTLNKTAPYHKPSMSIEYPVGSIMFKTDWLHEDEAKKLGLSQNSKHPYITMYMSSPTGDNDKGRFKKGLHYLMAITAASKDLPNWHWYAIEHVDNPGRCDYIGCNDSFGYLSTDNVPKGFARNYVAPKTKSDGLVSASPIFVTGLPYAAETITPALDKVFKGMNIGQKDSTNPKMPSPQDRAWLSYRLKGVQTEFVRHDGIKTVMGNSVTEGGFVNSSSCMTCHSQAAVNGQGQPAITSVGFSNRMNLTGYNQSSNGAPENSWFYVPGTFSPLNVQTDFVWGILFAQPIKK